MTIKYDKSLLNLSPEVIGFAPGLCPFADKTSSGRSKMYSTHLNQAMVLKGNQFPQIFSGKESELGTYELTTSYRNQDVRILAVIPKYRVLHGAFHIKQSPSTTVIYLGMQDNKVGYFDLHTYTEGSNGFGYQNVLMNTDLLRVGEFVPQEVKFQTSPIHRGSQYNLGTNANIIYLSHPDTIEDAMVISESLAKRLGTVGIETMSINIDEDQYPLNLYGDDTIYQVLPDIGDFVRDDGHLCALRTTDRTTFISDTFGDSIFTPKIHDEIFRVPPGSQILDIEVNIGKTNKISQQMFMQLEQYSDVALEYYHKVYKAYLEIKDQYEITPEFNTKVTTCIKRCVVGGYRIRGVDTKTRFTLAEKDKPIRFVQVNVTYMYDRPTGPGFKISDRYGLNKSLRNRQYS